MNRNWLCRIGLHKWKQVRRYSETGEIVYVWPGVRCRTHILWDGLERCGHCRKDVKDRRDWVELSLNWTFSILAIGMTLLLVVLLVAMVRLLIPSLSELWRLAFQ